MLATSGMTYLQFCSHWPYMALSVLSFLRQNDILFTFMSFFICTSSDQFHISLGFHLVLHSRSYFSVIHLYFKSPFQLLPEGQFLMPSNNRKERFVQDQCLVHSLFFCVFKGKIHFHNSLTQQRLSTLDKECILVSCIAENNSPECSYKFVGSTMSISYKLHSEVHRDYFLHHRSSEAHTQYDTVAERYQKRNTN